MLTRDQLDPKPAYFDHRIQMFERLYAEQQERAASASADLNIASCCARQSLGAALRSFRVLRADAGSDAPREPITVTLPDGSALEHRSWEVTPLQIAQQLSASLAKRVVIAKVRVMR